MYFRHEIFCLLTRFQKLKLMALKDVPSRQKDTNNEVKSLPQDSSDPILFGAKLDMSKIKFCSNRNDTQERLPIT